MPHPSLSPSSSTKDTHQLGNCYGRMGIVQLESCLLIEFADVVVVLFILFNGTPAHWQK